VLGYAVVRNSLVPRLFLVVVLGVPAGCQGHRETETKPLGTVGVAPPPPTVRSPVLSIGQEAKLPSYSIRLLSVRDCGATDAGIPGRNNTLLGVEVEIKSLSERPLPVNPFYLTLTDDDHFNYTTALLGCQPELRATRLSDGATARGFVSFEVPSDVNQFLAEYHPVLPANAKYTARFRFRR